MLGDVEKDKEMLEDIHNAEVNEDIACKSK